MVRRVLIVIALAGSVAGVLVAAAVMANGPGGPVAAWRSTPRVRHAPNIRVPSFGYSCEVASGNGCSLHPCIKYAQAAVPAANGATVITPAGSGRCSSTAQATPRAIPIVAP